MKSYCAVFNHFLTKYVLDEIIAEKTAEINSWEQQEGQSENLFSQKIWYKILRYGKVYAEYIPKGIFME